MHLEKPHIKYKKSFIEAVKEFQDDDIHSRYDNLNVHEIDQNFSNYIDELNSEYKGISLAKGRVPQTTYWLIDDNEYIGRVSIRHILNENLLKIGGHIGYDIRPSQRKKGYGKEMLKLALPLAKELGIDNALITCDVTNIASIKVIEANGGELENTVSVGNGRPDKHRFWIRID